MNQYTGAVEDDPSDNIDLLDGLQDEPIQDRDELPEDRFHQADIVSQHMIDTREKQRMEKVCPKPAILFSLVGETNDNILCNMRKRLFSCVRDGEFRRNSSVQEACYGSVSQFLLHGVFNFSSAFL